MITRLSRRIVLAGGGAVLGLPAMAEPQGETIADSAIGHAAADAIRDYACPGIAVAIARASNITRVHGYGLANIETQSAVSSQSIFRIGSLTKQFTAAAIIKLAQMGRLDLHGAAATYLPSFRSIKPFTILELMNHTAGLHSDEGGETMPSSVAPATTQVDLARGVAEQGKPFDFDPGTAWRYSNANYIVLGAIVESVTGMPFSRAMSELIFIPLGLPTLAVDKPSEIVMNRASGYSQTEGGPTSFENAAYLDVVQAGGAGAMRGSAADLCRWHDALLGHRLLDARHLALMLMPGRLRDGRPSSARRFSAEDAHYGDLEYACGMLISGPNDPNASILHYGGINGFAAVLQTYTKTRTSFAVLCNGDMGPALPFRAIRKEIIANYLL